MQVRHDFSVLNFQNQSDGTNNVEGKERSEKHFV